MGEAALVAADRAARVRPRGYRPRSRQTDSRAAAAARACAARRPPSRARIARPAQRAKRTRVFKRMSSHLQIRRSGRRGSANLHNLQSTRVLLESERDLHEELLRVAVPEGPEASRRDVQIQVVQSGWAFGNGGRGVLEASESLVHLTRRDLERDRLVRLGREQDVLPAPIGRLHVLLVSGHKTMTRNDTCAQISCLYEYIMRKKLGSKCGHTFGNLRVVHLKEKTLLSSL